MKNKQEDGPLAMQLSGPFHFLTDGSID